MAAALELQRLWHMRVFSFFFDDHLPQKMEVEYHARFQIPTFIILGLPAPEIQESRERIMAAFQAADWDFPKKKVIVNLVPSSVKKSGTGHDLAIALKIRSESETLDWPESILAWGELGLDGTIKPAGRMAALLELCLNPKGLIEAQALILCSEDAAALRQLLAWRKSAGLQFKSSFSIFVADHLTELMSNLKPVPLTEDQCFISSPSSLSSALLPLSAETERLLKISLIGKHHVLLLGPKGVGKSESLHWFRAASPHPEPQQVWTRLLNSESRQLPFTFDAPVRRVHSQVKPSHLLGSFGPKGYQAGELALAHGGQFIADEFMEWARDSKECLRQPLQDKRATLTRVKGAIETECDFQLIATGNLCPCGGLPAQFRSYDSEKRYPCRCRAPEVQKYLQKLSGPILDRIDLVFVMTATKARKDTISLSGLQKTIQESRCFAKTKFSALPSELTPAWLEENLVPQSASIEKLLKPLPSLRSRHKVLRVARSIQALEQDAELKDVHVFEAITYRISALA